VSARPVFASFGADPKMLAVALAIDVLLADPPNAVHPVAWIGRLTGALIRRAPKTGPGRQLVAGGLIVLTVCGACGGSVLVLARATATTPTLAFWLGAVVLKCTFAIRGLGAAGRVVRVALSKGRVGDARLALSALCSRDAASLGERQLAASTIESLAENLSDSFVAPLLAYAVFGLWGAVVYRAANTLDAMIGYRGRHEYLGKIAARFDDLLNLIPARLTAGLLLMAGGLTGADVRGGLRILRRDRGVTASPNAGWPMATMAGLLGVALEKPGHYRLGDATRPVIADDIARAWRIVALAAALAGSAVLAIVLAGRAHGS
jgi:adenosylcobinamide-phosphate synthase